jgi:hypothetical protein
MIRWCSETAYPNIRFEAVCSRNKIRCKYKVLVGHKYKDCFNLGSLDQSLEESRGNSWALPVEAAIGS